MRSVAVVRPEHTIPTIPIVRPARNSATTTTRVVGAELGGLQGLALFETAHRSTKRRFGISARESTRGAARVWCEATANDIARDGISLFQRQRPSEFFGQPVLTSSVRH